MDLTRSPLARPFPDLPPIAGATPRVARARYKDWDRCDLTLIDFAEGTAVAGLFTKSACASHEVEAGRAQIGGGYARALVVNAGNSNAFTGAAGREAVTQIQAQVGEGLDCAPEDVFVCSTGVIGVPLPKDRAREGVAAVLEAEPCSWLEVTKAIGTTDTFEKGARASAFIGDTRVELVGVIKGSGMIAPDMATMLGYIVTDAAMEPALLQELLSEANVSSFSSITVDSDTSTSDTVLAFATGAAGNAVLSGRDSPGADAFASALQDLCDQLAKLVVRDGEGATKFIEVRVSGAQSDASAHRIAKSIANSPLVKTAIAGEDANWGRVVMAVGKAGEPADRDRLSIGFGGVEVARDGRAVEGFDEAPVTNHLQGQEIIVEADLGIGTGRARVYTCDLTHGYIAINADYRS